VKPDVRFTPLNTICCTSLLVTFDGLLATWLPSGKAPIELTNIVVFPVELE